jgi:hypothetical protein
VIFGNSMILEAARLMSGCAFAEEL